MNRKVFIFFAASVVITVFWAVITLYALKMTLPYNAAKLPLDNRTNRTTFKAVLPEGFSFFTRSPREEQVVLFRVENGALERFGAVNGSVENLFGLKKDTRSHNMEMGTLFSQIDKSEWLLCKATLDDCLNYPDTPTLFIENNYKNPFLCGDFLIVVREPVPWAWANNMKPDAMPTQFVRISVKCK